MFMKALSTALAVVILAAQVALAAPANANPTHLPGHPRVNQVNRRIRTQQARIVEGVRQGHITPRQARQLARERFGIKREERAMRRADHGRLTRADQRVLNRGLSGRSRQIYRERHR